MADVITSRYKFTNPEVGASDNTWGTKLNDNFTKLETLFNSKFVNGNVADLGSYAVRDVSQVRYDGVVTSDAPYANITLRGTDGETITAYTMRLNVMDGGATSRLNNVLRYQDIAGAILDGILDPIITAVVDKIYPVGSTIFSVSSTNPGSRFPGTTWVATAAGRAIFGVGSAGGVTWAVNDTKGSGSVTLAVANLPSHTHGDSFSINSVGNHTHSITVGDGGTNFTFDIHPTSGNPALIIARSGGLTTSYVSANLARLERAGTANLDAQRASYNASHSHNASATNSGGHTHSLSGSVGSTGSGNSFSIIPPGQAFYVWRRSA